MDDAPRTKRDILQRNARAAEAIDRALAELTNEQMLAPPADGGWAARDVLAHLGADLRWMSAQIEAGLDGREPTALDAFGTEEPPAAPFDLSVQDGRNAAQQERTRDLSLGEVRDNWNLYRERMEALIERLAEDEFTALYAIAPLGHVGHVRPAGEHEQGWPLWRWLAGNTWHHFEDHLSDFEASKKR